MLYAFYFNKSYIFIDLNLKNSLFHYGITYNRVVINGIWLQGVPFGFASSSPALAIVLLAIL